MGILQAAGIMLTLVACPVNALPLLFMTQEDIQAPWGLQWPVTSGLATNLSAGQLNRTRLPKILEGVVQGGLMEPNPIRPEDGFEIFYEAALPSSNTSRGLFFVTTSDFVNYTNPVQVRS